MMFVLRDLIQPRSTLGLTLLVAAIGLLAAPWAVASDLEVTGEGPASADPGSTVQYNFTVTNLGGAVPNPTFYFTPEYAWDGHYYFAEPVEPFPSLGVVFPGDGTQPDCDTNLSNPAPWTFTTSRGSCYLSMECGSEVVYSTLMVQCDLGGMLTGDTANISISVPFAMDPPPEADMYFNQPTSMGDWYQGAADPLLGFWPSTFGPSLWFDAPATGDLKLCQDNTGTPERGCGVWIGDYTGKIVLIQRGDCNFENKVMSAQLAGAVGAIIFNRYPFDDPTNGGYSNMAGDTLGPFITIPNAFISLEAGEALKTALTAGTVNLTLGPQHPVPWLQESSILVYDANDDNPDNNELYDVVEVGGGAVVAPVASFTYAPAAPLAGGNVTFTDTSTNTPTSWAWDFGDTGTSTEQNPVHVFAAAGAYTVTLTATNAGGSNAATQTVTVLPVVVLPDAQFTFAPTEPEVLETVQFTDASTGGPTTWAWDFGDGSTSADQNPTHAYAAAGNFTVSLTVTNADGSDTATAAITVVEPSAGPDAAFSFTPTSPLVGETVQFTDQSTGDPTTWAWDFGDGGTSDVQNPSHVYTAAGTYTVSLTVTNADGSDTTPQAIVVSEEITLDRHYFVPAAAVAPGTAGSNWVTDLDVNNAGAEMMSYQLLWLPRDTDNSAPTASDTFTLGPGMSVRYANVLSEVFELSEVFGALGVFADSEYALLMSRTFNQAAEGTFGQAIPGYAESALIPAGTRVRVLFMTENDNFRSNLGLLNGTGAPIDIMYERYGADGLSLGTETETLAAWSNTQVNRVFQADAPVEAAYVDVWTETAGGAFLCYGSVVDNVTSDPTTVLPQ